jgi:hypothetical protein
VEQIGHVRKHSDKIWKEFKDACNHYFNKLKEQKTNTALKKLKRLTEILFRNLEYQLTGDHKTDLDAIKLHIETWKILEKFLFRRHIEGSSIKSRCSFDKLSLKRHRLLRFSIEWIIMKIMILKNRK